jgi:hypothetical protein
MSSPALADVMMDGNYWRGRGQATRALAEVMRDPVAKSMMLTIGAEYELLAQRIDERRMQPPSVEQYPARFGSGCGKPALFCVK